MPDLPGTMSVVVDRIGQCKCEITAVQGNPARQTGQKNDEDKRIERGKYPQDPAEVELLQRNRAGLLALTHEQRGNQESGDYKENQHAQVSYVTKRASVIRCADREAVRATEMPVSHQQDRNGAETVKRGDSTGAVGHDGWKLLVGTNEYRDLSSHVANGSRQFSTRSGGSMKRESSCQVPVISLVGEHGTGRSWQSHETANSADLVSLVRRTVPPAGNSSRRSQQFAVHRKRALNHDALVKMRDCLCARSSSQSGRQFGRINQAGDRMGQRASITRR